MAEPVRPFASSQVDPQSGRPWTELVDAQLDRSAEVLGDATFQRLVSALNDIAHPRVQLAFLRAETGRLQSGRDPVRVLVDCRRCGTDDGLLQVHDPAADPAGYHGVYRPCPDCNPAGAAAWHADHLGCRRRDCDLCRSLRYGGAGTAVAAAAARAGGTSWYE